MPFLTSAPAGLELRLDQRQQVGRRLRQRERRRQHELERDEARIDGDEVGPLRQQRRIEAADVGILERHDLGAAAQARMQLAAPDIDRVDPPGAAREQDLGEAAGRGADIEADAPGGSNIRSQRK